MPKKPTSPDEGLPMVELVIPNEFVAARAAEEEILQKVERHGFRPEAAFAIRLSLEEAITNAVKHGNRGDRNKRIFLRYHVDDQLAVICIRDEGNGFDPRRIPDPTAPNRLSLPNGRGIMLMEAYMDEVQFNETGNEVRLVKRRT